ncbi:MAG: DUF4388 domain-containing protein [Acidobacteriota bacterium]|nr:DUF4388 domain-containing protein [Acidobacteriota bacterium]MDH3522623.1 DUF4388 domain-containing protein [Acidobacteriota bacterium]
MSEGKRAMQMSGLLETFPLADLLQWAGNDRLTGTIVLRRGAREKRILLRGGRVVGCLSNERHEFYGDLLLANGLVTESQLLTALSLCTEHRSQIRLGEALIQLGILDREAVVESLVARTEQSILDVFLWPRGVFFVLRDEPPVAPIEIPPIEPMRLVLEGVRQIDEVRRIRMRLPHDGVVLKRGTAWPGVDLSPLGRRIVTVFEPNSTLARLHEAAGGGYCAFLAEADGLLQGAVLAIDHPGEPTSDSQTISLLDLMLDRIQEERQAVVGGTVAMPLSALGELYPLWLDRDDPVAGARLAAPMRGFAASFDGTRKLAALLSGDLRRRDDELEWLWLQIGARRLVLMPDAVDDELRRRIAAGVRPT